MFIVGKGWMMEFLMVFFNLYLLFVVCVVGVIGLVFVLLVI